MGTGRPDSADLGNETVGVDDADLHRRHDGAPEACRLCPKIRKIASADPDRSLGVRVLSAEEAKPRSRRLPQGASRADIAQAEMAFHRWREPSESEHKAQRDESEGDEGKTQRRPSALSTFPVGTSIEVALQCGVLTARQADILGAWIEAEGDISLRQLGREANCSHHAAHAELKQLYAVVASEEKEFVEVRRPRRSLVIVRVRGQRELRAYVKHSICLRIGNETREESWLERVDHRPVVRRLLREDHFEPDREFVPMRISPMRELLAALARAKAEDKQDRDLLGPPVGQSPDWTHNLGWAETRLQKAGWRGSRSLTEVIRGLAWKSRVCPACHTPILAGCRLDGKRIARDRRFCDDACKMTYRRRSARVN